MAHVLSTINSLFLQPNIKNKMSPSLHNPFGLMDSNLKPRPIHFVLHLGPRWGPNLPYIQYGGWVKDLVRFATVGRPRYSLNKKVKVALVIFIFENFSFSQKLSYLLSSSSHKKTLYNSWRTWILKAKVSEIIHVFVTLIPWKTRSIC